MAKLRLAVLLSGNGSNLQAIIDRCTANQAKAEVIDAEVVVVISDQPGAYGLQRAAAASIPHETLDRRSFTSRESFDQALKQCIDPYAVDLVVLAGFMRILSPAFVQHYAGRIVNIHPSLLPKYPGLHTHRRALQAGDKVHGASVHFVTPELDGGPVILQAHVPVLADDDEHTLAARVLEKEHLIYPTVIQWMATHRLSLDAQSRIVLDGKVLQQPALLSEPT